jgi:hypothetical protein
MRASACRSLWVVDQQSLLAEDQSTAAGVIMSGIWSLRKGYTFQGENLLMILAWDKWTRS